MSDVAGLDLLPQTREYPATEQAGAASGADSSDRAAQFEPLLRRADRQGWGFESLRVRQYLP